MGATKRRGFLGGYVVHCDRCGRVGSWHLSTDAEKARRQHAGHGKKKK